MEPRLASTLLKTWSVTFGRVMSAMLMCVTVALSQAAETQAAETQAAEN